MTPLEVPSLIDQVYKRLLEAISDHSLAPGARIRQGELADTIVKMASLGVGRDGSFYAVDYDRGQIFELERQPPAKPLPPFPRKLSETGLFTSVAKHQAAPGVIPYEINAPFWSDVVERVLLSSKLRI